MNKKIVAANWKMNPQTLQEAEDLFRASSGAIVFPPSEFIEALSKIDSGAVLGVQDISLDDKSLVSPGVKYVLIGHSDRRWKLGESGQIVNQKLKLALSWGLAPIVCVGEKFRDSDFKSFLENQTLDTFAGLSGGQIEKCLIAYEPVWAISATPGSRPDTPESALESIRIIKNTLIENLPKVLYGGSVTSINVRDFLAMNEIFGVLVGQASLDKEEFKKIMAIVFSLQ